MNRLIQQIKQYIILLYQLKELKQLSLKQYSQREVQRILRKNGFHRIRSKGSHNIYSKRGELNITIPYKSDPNKMMVHRLIKSYNLFI